MFTDEAALEERLATPSSALIADLAGLEGDLLVLGAGGKMGPSLCRLARRALDAAGRTDVTVYAVSRWSDRAAAEELEAAGVSTVAFDLMDPGADLGELPEAGNIVFMVGAKFGSAGAPSHAWAVNAAMPDRVAHRWPAARIAAFSTGNVYPLVPVSSGGCTESDPVGPVGEYAMSCLGRERIFDHAALTRGTKVANIRLNYAVDLRYGVLADIASRVSAGEPVDVTTGHANVVWQGYANEVALRSLLHATDGTAFTLNLTGPETASVRRLAQWFGEEFDREPVFAGAEAPTALLSDASRCHALFGYPDVTLRTLVAWQADWLRRGLPLSGKPTKFQVRDGRF
ncbi:NAD-dependent epimerase/dehydratase family protein [Streptomyces sp. NBC_01237]|uniref:NAD-dependent epimerase/dehydratase family protein n=1 Tax=Streptomyces sp. NBC_01237 TaxID=2903790 RepID=UPI002DDC71B2|nr:NAD-dependent epimerase/dehydratase family protein [Streptomyces sp. NBC_01237]WRZ71293.1 NAD-dependent epimerase/dehydratase family protein [Streptomyces sp. NBC_01237]